RRRESGGKKRPGRARPGRPPIPVTDAPASFGNVSEVIVYRFADQPWCAAVASPTSAIVTTGPGANAAIAATGIQKAQTAIAVRRARRVSPARPITVPRHQPPPPPPEPRHEHPTRRPPRLLLRSL